MPVDCIRQPTADFAFERTTIPTFYDELVDHHERQVRILETVNGELDATNLVALLQVPDQRIRNVLFLALKDVLAHVVQAVSRRTLRTSKSLLDFFHYVEDYSALDL